jgi:translation elongation factor EF-1alpha
MVKCIIVSISREFKELLDLSASEKAIVTFIPLSPLCLDLQIMSKRLGLIIIKKDGVEIASGSIIEINKIKN